MVDPTGVGILASQANTLTLSGLNPSHLICMICTNKSNILTSDCHTLFLSLPLNASCCSCMVSPMQNVIRLRLLPAALQETFLFTLDIQLLIARFFLLFCMTYCLYMKKWSHYCTIGFSILALIVGRLGCAHVLPDRLKLYAQPSWHAVHAACTVWEGIAHHCKKSQLCKDCLQVWGDSGSISITTYLCLSSSIGF